MTKDVLTIDINDSLQSANKLFRKHPIRHLPVLSENKLIGILSQTDILRISFGNAFSDEQENGDEAIFEMLSINQVMKHSPVTTHPDSSINEAGELFTRREFHALPVVKDDKLVGIITTTDIIKYFLNHA